VTPTEQQFAGERHLKECLELAKRWSVELIFDNLVDEFLN
jgi:hypothetical protein